MFQMGFQQTFLPSRLQRNVSSFYFQHVCLPVRVGCMLNGNTFQLESAACASETSVLLVALFQVNLCFLKNQPLSTLQTRRDTKIPLNIAKERERARERERERERRKQTSTQTHKQPPNDLRIRSQPTMPGRVRASTAKGRGLLNKIPNNGYAG